MQGMEATTDKVARTMFEVNVWSAGNVTRETVRSFREVNKPVMWGSLMQVSAATAKYAPEGLSDSSLKELDPTWNIKVTIS
ncbi:hypothetical protein A0H81_07071 [Grifola frondosa]|uniref:Uncharacterized protein n=1 Tax=Grifola frondosa TaxID=5627 RepID=A0A1C7MA06_GRIFR|nr:hypothetical protein A0H81_07071 [Grifola frondosa]